MLSFQRKERERKTKYKTLRRFLRWCKFEYKQTNKKTLPETFGGTLCCCYWFICLLCGEESLPRSALRTYLSQHIKSNRMCQTQWNVTQKSLHRLHYLICLIVSVGRFWWSSFGAITSHMHFTFCFFFFFAYLFIMYICQWQRVEKPHYWMKRSAWMFLCSMWNRAQYISGGHIYMPSIGQNMTILQ